MARKRSVSFRLLKTEIVNPVDALKDGHRLAEKPLADSPINKRLFVGQAYSNPPKWLSFFNSVDHGKFAGLFGAQAAAILFVSINQPTEEDIAQNNIPDEGVGAVARWVAVCFGMGFQSLRPEALESQFGLKVALNRIGQDRIKSIDTRRPEDATIQTRSQNSRTGEIFDFGVDTNHIILQAITGKCSDEAFGGTLSGADGLKLNCEIDYTIVDNKTTQIIEAFASNAYESLFPWYGRITPIRDREQIDLLDEEMIRWLRGGDLDNIHLAPPEIVDYQNIDAFKFTGEGRDEDSHDELRIADYLTHFDDGDLTLAHLKSDKVRTKAEDQERFIDRWTVYKCTCAELEIDGTLYVLAAGDWYAVVRDFVNRINNEIAEIPHSTISLPTHQVGESEAHYNERAARVSSNLHLFDQSLVRFQGERGPVEFCDLLSEDRQIIHVKKRSRSSLLSHLFMQGYVSAEAFVDYPSLRRTIRAKIPAIQHLIPEGVPSTPEYEVVFALLHSGMVTLPFFSKVALATIYRQLKRMQYRVSIAWIGPAGAV